jgi:hypothetical protein
MKRLTLLAFSLVALFGNGAAAGERVKVAGFVVRLPSGEIIVDAPGEQDARVPSLAAELAPLAGPRPAPVLEGAVEPRSFAGALSTGSEMAGTRTSTAIVVVEGRLDRATHEMTDARITTTVKADAWLPAFAKYEAALKARLPSTPASADPVTVELALDGIAAPLERLVTADDRKFFEPLRWIARLTDAIRRLQRIDRERELATWTETSLPERSVDGPLVLRPRPTSAEREAYRTMFLLGGVLADRTLTGLERGPEPCRLFREAVRLLRAYDARSPLLADITSRAAQGRPNCP